MRHYKPSLGIRETAKNIKYYISANKQAFWDVLTPLLPWIIGLHLLDAAITYLYFPVSEDGKGGFALGSIISGYFYAALVISWHRVVIKGADRYVPVNPFRPKKHELVFMGVGVLLVIIYIIFVAVLALIATMLGEAAVALAILASMVAIFYVGYKISFYFPAKAVNASISFRESFNMTRGYFWKLVLAPLLAMLKPLGLMILYIIAVLALGFLTGMLTGSAGDSGKLLTFIGFLFQLPILAYFQPLFYVIGVTALSNYYLHALSHDPSAGKDIR